jgi:hypothetical protein
MLQNSTTTVSEHVASIDSAGCFAGIRSYVHFALSRGYDDASDALAKWCIILQPTLPCGGNARSVAVRLVSREVQSWYAIRAATPPTDAARDAGGALPSRTSTYPHLTLTGRSLTWTS